MDSITKVKDLIKSLSQYDQELNIIFCDSSYSSIDYEDCEIDRDLVIGKDATKKYTNKYIVFCFICKIFNLRSNHCYTCFIIAWVKYE